MRTGSTCAADSAQSAVAVECSGSAVVGAVTHNECVCVCVCDPQAYCSSYPRHTVILSLDLIMYYGCA